MGKHSRILKILNGFFNGLTFLPKSQGTAKLKHVFTLVIAPELLGVEFGHISSLQKHLGEIFWQKTYYTTSRGSLFADIDATDHLTETEVQRTQSLSTCTKSRGSRR